MIVIFHFSSEAGGESGGRSAIIARWLMERGVPGSFDSVAFVVRKFAHMTEYAVLAILTFVALRGTTRRMAEHRVSLSQGRTLAGAFTVAAVYAATDEFHQLFIPGRTGTPKDVLIDSAGAAIGLALAWLVSRRRPH